MPCFVLAVRGILYASNSRPLLFFLALLLLGRILLVFAGRLAMGINIAPSLRITSFILHLSHIE